jgi:FtsP/CotA-like multicopper oxidase with cupredoxin domain
MRYEDLLRMSRRDLLKLGGTVALGSAAGAFRPNSAFADGTLPPPYIEAFPTSPLIGGRGVDSHGKAVGSAFVELLPIPKAMAPVPVSEYSAWRNPPGPGIGQQDSTNYTHQLWPSALGYPDPLVYDIKVNVGASTVSGLDVLPINSSGQPTQSFDSVLNTYAPGTLRKLPYSCNYTFNGGLPRINAEYGKPVLVRFENTLDVNPDNWDRQDFGDPEYCFLTHLHNGHTAAESDGNPHHKMWRDGVGGYRPGQFVDNLYLNYPAGGDNKEKQSFFWFHDHRMDHTGANVYKGMVGIFPIYDPEQGMMDGGDETQGLRLPGVRTNNSDGSFDVDYDLPLVFYDCRLDDGVTPHKDFHSGNGEFHPEWWGKSFFKHFPNHGFVGDVFTVNFVAYPVTEVKRRKYRLRFLDASISRIYEFKLMSSTGGPKSAASLGYQGNELQGQYRIPDGQQCMKWTQIASEGGLLPAPIVRDSFELWPAKRREFIVDFTKYQDGSPTKKGDVIYLTNIMKMPDGRMWSNSSRFSLDQNYKVPVLKIVIGDDAVDNSQIPTVLRQVPKFNYGDWKKDVDTAPVFELQRGSSSTDPEIEWLINGVPFDPTHPLIAVKKGSYAVWKIRNGGGGWVHPMHLHMEEHRVVMRNGKLTGSQSSGPSNNEGHIDDVSKEDVVALDPSEEVVICRYFRTFTGKYVAHCHNLAHEDHAMMFGWEIVP